MDPDAFYRLFTPPTPSGCLAVVPSLAPYARALVAYHGLDGAAVHAGGHDARPRAVELDPRRALLLLSGGVDSTWLLLDAQKKGYEVVPVFVDMLNPTVSYREMPAARAVARAAGVRLRVVTHAKALRKLHRQPPNLLVHGAATKESVCKNQYALLLCLPLLESERCGTVLVSGGMTRDPTRPNATASYFSDERAAYELFAGHLRSLYPRLAMHIVVASRASPASETAPGSAVSVANVSYARKVADLVETGIFGATHSCYMRAQFFQHHHDRTGAPYEHMCGCCFKCKLLLRVLHELSRGARTS